MTHHNNIKNILEKCEWKWAKTYEEIAPHWYTKKIWFSNIDEFDLLVKHINSCGKKEQFMNKTYTYYYCGKYKYWTMSQHPDAILLNKAYGEQVKEQIRHNK